MNEQYYPTSTNLYLVLSTLYLVHEKQKTSNYLNAIPGTLYFVLSTNYYLILDTSYLILIYDIKRPHSPRNP